MTDAFFVAEVVHPIIDATFLRRHRLALNLNRRCLQDAFMNEVVAEGVPSPKDAANVSMLRTTQVSRIDLGAVINDFPTVCLESTALLKSGHGVEHHIETTGGPVHTRPHPLAPGCLQEVRKHFEQLEAEGVIRRSS